MARDYAKNPVQDPAFQNAQREQIVINTRLTAMQAAVEVMQLQGYAGETTMAERIKLAKEAETYILSGIETVKPKSAIVMQTNMPPEGMFKPGE